MIDKMYKIFFFTLIFIITLLCGCDEVSVIDPQTAYKEYLVVRAEIIAGSHFSGVAITKTLPINEPYDTAKARLKNVVVYVKINGIRIIPLHYFQRGIYRPNGAVYIAPGDVYELFVEADSTNIYAITKVPQIPVVNSASFTNNYILAQVEPNHSEVYGAAWAIVNPATKNVLDEAKDFLSIVNSSNENSNSAFSVSTLDLPAEYRSEAYKGFRCARVYAFDTPYQKYFNTKNNNQPISNSFVQGGDQIVWNVQGKNVIGLFIGVAAGSYVKSN